MYNLKTDGGAAGDGTTNDAPAFRAAITALLGSNADGGELYIPPGEYKLAPEGGRSQAVDVGLVGGNLSRGSLLIRGEAGASKILCAYPGSYDGFQFGNLNRVTIRDLIARGQSGTGIDGRRLFSFSSVGHALIERCDFIGVRMSDGGLGAHIAMVSSRLAVRHCNFFGCSGEQAFIVGGSGGSLTVADCDFIDINCAVDNTVVQKAGVAFDSYIRWTGATWPPAGAPDQGTLVVERCGFDEASACNCVHVDPPDGSQRLDRVYIADCNVLNNLSAIPFLLSHCDKIDMERLAFYARTGHQATLIQITDGGDVYMRAINSKDDAGVTSLISVDGTTRSHEAYACRVGAIQSGAASRLFANNTHSPWNSGAGSP